jgi:predicted MFS family arabinose efflux permease
MAIQLGPSQLRATSVGAYAMVIGLTGLIASNVAGQLWDRVGPSAAFWYGGSLSFAAVILLWLTLPVELNPASPYENGTAG